MVELNNLNGSGENVDLQNVDVIRVSNTNGQGDHKIIENEMKEHVEHVENEEVKRKNTGKQKHRHSPTGFFSFTQNFAKHFISVLDKSN